MKEAIWIYFGMLLCLSNRLAQPWDCKDARNYTVRSLSYGQTLFFEHTYNDRKDPVRRGSSYDLVSEMAFS